MSRLRCHGGQEDCWRGRLEQRRRTFRFHNPSPNPNAHVTTVTTTGYTVTASGGTGTCASSLPTLAASYTLNTADIAAGGFLTVTVAAGVAAPAALPDGCQGAVFDFAGLTVNTTT